MCNTCKLGVIYENLTKHTFHRWNSKGNNETRNQYHRIYLELLRKIPLSQPYIKFFSV